MTVDGFSDGVDAVSVAHRVPEGWTVLPYGDARTDGRERGPTRVDLGTVWREDLGTVWREDLGTRAARKKYYAEATGDSGEYTFGPASAAIERTGDGAPAFGEDAEDSFGGTDTNAFVGVGRTSESESA